MVLHLNASLTPNSATPVTVAQDVYVSNIAYLPVTNQGTDTSSNTSTVPLSVTRRGNAIVKSGRPVPPSVDASRTTARPQTRAGGILDK